jgi:hypothetical protein
VTSLENDVVEREIHILAHALDHLALLNCCDESIKAVLETGWLETLATRLPKPAGYLARG